ncbi:MAG: hypothetical protein ACXVCP_10530 [Bdellovibrio sp.]
MNTLLIAGFALFSFFSLEAISMEANLSLVQRHCNRSLNVNKVITDQKNYALLGSWGNNATMIKNGVDIAQVSPPAGARQLNYVDGTSSNDTLYLFGNAVTKGYQNGFILEQVPFISTNGQIKYLNVPNGFAEAKGIAVVNKDIYVYGRYREKPDPYTSLDKQFIYKNEKPFEFSFKEKAEIRSISAIDNDLYLTGNIFENGSRGQIYPSYWKNDILMPLENKGENGYASGVLKVGTDVIVYGHDGHPGAMAGTQAVVWVNGQHKKLKGDFFVSYIQSATVHGKDLVLLGSFLKENFSSKTTGVIWINDNDPLILPEPNFDISNDKSYHIFKFIFSSNGKIYLFGEEIAQEFKCSKIWELKR